MIDISDQCADNTPAATALNMMDPDTFAQFVRDSLGPNTDPAVWEALTDPSVIARTKNYLGSLHADVQTQLTQANARLNAIRSDCLERGDEGKREFFHARSEQAEWRSRAIGFRRIIERRLAFVKSRTAVIAAGRPVSSPGLTKPARKHNLAALEALTRAITEHQRRVTGAGVPVPLADERLWESLTSVTAMVRTGEELPLAEWLEYLDDLRG